MDKLIIGRKDKADFPELKITDIDIKIDSGAYTSSIHCHNIELIEKRGKKFVSFHLLDPSHPDYNEKEYILPFYQKKRVKSSNGTTETRYIIKTNIVLFKKKFIIELSLTDRSDMKYPVLLGRKILMSNFIIDVDKVNLSYKSKLKKSRN